jgi:hypothetical protein
MANLGNTSPHIMSTSGTLLGVTMTVLSLSRLDDDHTLFFWLIDKLVAVSSLIFLFSCVLSFRSIQCTNVVLATQFERRAEYLFMAGLVLLAAGAVTLAFVIE